MANPIQIMGNVLAKLGLSCELEGWEQIPTCAESEVNLTIVFSGAFALRITSWSYFEVFL